MGLVDCLKNDYCRLHMVFFILEANFHHATGFRNGANMTGGQRMYCVAVSQVIQENFEKGRSVAVLKNLGRDACPLKQKVVNILSPVCTSRLFMLKLRLLHHLMEDN